MAAWLRIKLKYCRIFVFSNSLMKKGLNGVNYLAYNDGFCFKKLSD